MIIIGVLIIVVPPPPPGEQQPFSFQQQPIASDRDPNMIYRDCDCGWWGSYTTESKAKMGFASHRRWCQAGHGHKVLW